MLKQRTTCLPWKCTVSDHESDLFDYKRDWMELGFPIAFVDPTDLSGYLELLVARTHDGRRASTHGSNSG